MLKSIYFSGTHFHDIQHCFDQLKNVEDTKSGYANGSKAFPRYEAVVAGETDATLAVKVVFDPEKISIHELVEYYLHCITLGQESPHHMRKGIYYDDLLDGVEAEIAVTEHAGKDHCIEILKLCNFFPAELAHQHYYQAHQEERCALDFSFIDDHQRKQNA